MMKRGYLIIISLLFILSLYNVTAPNPGQCTSSDQCGEGQTCADFFCKSISPQESQDITFSQNINGFPQGRACTATAQCDSGLICNSNSCVNPFSDVQPNQPLNIPPLFAVVPSEQCAQAKTLFKLSSLEDAHAALYNDPIYSYSVCYSQGVSSANRNGPLGGIVKLSGTANAHLGILNSDYLQRVFYSELQCASISNGQACPSSTGTKCAVKLSTNVNAHAASCDAPPSLYPISICCRPKTDAVLVIDDDVLSGRGGSCTTDRNCQEPYKCNTALSQCVVVNPCLGVSCPQGQSCLDGDCFSTDPTKCNPRCNSGEACITGSDGSNCVPLDSSNCDPPCPPEQTCMKFFNFNKGTCSFFDNPEGCNPRCESGKVCRGNQCVGTTGVACLNPCPPGKVCKNGRCESPFTGVACLRPCQNGEICRDGQCVSNVENCNGVNCPANQKCDPIDGACKTICTNENDCGNNGNCNNKNICEDCENNLDTDNDGKDDCEDSCPFDGSKTTGSCGGSGSGDPNDNGDGGRVRTTCAQLNGVLCPTSAGCSGGSTVSTRTAEFPCCVGDRARNIIASCAQDSFNSALGTVITTERSACEDTDGDGIGISVVTIKDATTREIINTESLVQLGLESAVYEEECRTLPEDEGQPIPFYTFGSLLLTALLLIGYYFAPRIRNRKV